MTERKYTISKAGAVRVAILAAVACVFAGIAVSALFPAAPTARAQARPQGTSAPTPHTRPAAPAESLTGTVRAVDVRTGTIELVTGVGYALRIRHLQLPRELKVMAGRAESATSALTPGTIIRVHYRPTESGMAPSTVEVLQAPPRGAR